MLRTLDRKPGRTALRSARSEDHVRVPAITPAAAPPPHVPLPGSNLGDASSHSTKNLPVLLAGGGFKHGQHLHFDPQNPPPLCNLDVSMLQLLDIETDHFGTSNGTLSGLAVD